MKIINILINIVWKDPFLKHYWHLYLGYQVFFLAAIKGFIPFQLKGYMDIVITDVLIDESGTVVDVQYGRDIGHHYSFEKIKEFSQ